jgi:hypothetical protein
VFKRLFFLLPTFFLMACGGGGGKSSGGSPNPANNPQTITVSGGILTGVDITALAPASNPTPNAQFLGVTPSNQAFNVGSVIFRGDTQDVFLFGPGLDKVTSVSISGSDLSLTNAHVISSTGGTPGIAVTVGVPPGAEPGLRTIYLTDVNNDLTTFTGGLEVI